MKEVDELCEDTITCGFEVRRSGVYFIELNIEQILMQSQQP